MRFQIVQFFLLSPFVGRVNRRICIRMVRFWRSTWDVEMVIACGRPITSIPAE